jgi:DNA-binding MarR family transcriptional regulator
MRYALCAWLYADAMDQDKLRTLKLLEAIDSAAPPTQRELARDLNISLGLVNAFIKRLAKKGYFKITTIPKKRAKYLLTPKGALEKSRLTYEYIRYSVGFYREIREMLVNLFGRLEREGVEQIALYGCGEVAELAHLFLQNTSIKLAGVFDQKPDGRKFFGYRVKSHEQLVNDGCEYILLTQTEDIQSHFDLLVDLGVKAECILHLRGHSE